MPAPVRTLDELRARRGEAVLVGTMTDSLGGPLKIGVLGATPVIMQDVPGDVTTPEARAEFTALWLKACRQAGIKRQEAPGGE